MIKHFAVIALALTVSSPALATVDTPTTPDPFLSHYLEDVWGTILDHNDSGKWNQQIDNGVMVSTIWRAGCVDDPSVCLQIERIYPSGDIVREFVPFDI